MGSRLRENPRRLFECWCEVVGPKGTDRPPWIIQKFPDSYSKEEREKEILKSVPQFAFPCSFDSTNVQHFSFVLTSLDSKWTYGFCRHAPGSETALVILSHLPWHETFYKLLNHLADMIGNERTQDMTSCLQSIYCTKVPLPGSEIAVPYGDNKFFVAQCPNHLRLPTIPENRNLSEYYNAVDANNMMIIFASMLHERRIIMVSKRLSRLSACVQAANSIIYPMQWQHIFIPVLPEHLTDYLLAPMPYLIGVNSSLLSKVQMEDIGEAVILDADNNVVKTPFNDLETLPDEVIINLRRSLKNPNNMLGDHVARAFLRALVQIIGNYKEALQFREEDSKITFNREKFVNIRPNTFQPFVEKMLELQIFRQFIEERLDRLNSGKQTSDEFELEVSVHCEKSSSKMRQQYKQFVTNVRKEGGAIMKSVKSKTNPAVKSAVKTVTKGGKQVKEKSRQTYKDIRGKIKEIHQPRIGDDGNAPAWVNGDSPQKPRSAPSSPVMGVKRRPRTVGGNVPGFSAKTTYKRASQINIREDSSALPGTRKYELIESGIMSPSSDSLSTPSPQSIDLMGEMEEIIKAKLGDDFEELASSRSNDSIQSSISSSAGESPGSGSASGSASTITVRKNVKDHPPSGLTAKKLSKPILAPLAINVNAAEWMCKSYVYRGQLSASLTSLPLIDLSLNIELPPPIMASFGYRFPVTFDDDSNGGGEDGDGLGSSSTSHFRSPKLLHDTDFTAPEADNSVVDSHLWGHTHLPSSSTSHSANDGSNISAVCTSYSTIPREHKKSGTRRGQFRDCSASKCTIPVCKTIATKITTDFPATCYASSALSPAKLHSQCGHASLSPSRSPQQPRRVVGLESSSVSSVRSSTDFPKYGASQAFSASLSKYSTTKQGTPGYFYSKLTKSIDDDAPVAEFEAIESSEDFILCSPVNIPHATFSSSQPGYAGNLLFFSSASQTTDIMTMSLPAVLTSISPPLQSPSQGRSLSPALNPPHSPLSPSSYYPPSPDPPRPSSTQSRHPDKSLSPLPPPPPSLGRRTRSPSPHHGLNQGSGEEEDGNGQDLIFLESPQDEIFDPLLSKDITPKHKRPTQSPPPIPTTKSTSNLPGKLNHKDLSGSASTSHLPSKNVPHPALARTAAINTTGLPNATPNRTSEYRPLTPFQSSAPEYRPFSTLQTNLGVPVGCQNPIYNQHKPLGEHPLPNATRSGSATAAFATSMLSRAPDESSLNMVNRSSPYVQFEPPVSHATKGLNSSSSQPQRPPRLSQKDLLGDFSKDFQKLSVNSPSRAASPANNNNTILNNNKTCDAIHAAESDSADQSESKWATFD
ncbi:uncharacterized protein LOC135200910 isoform X2 [Macrobrachium nipponense]|uniref:uncharacterized protein LOC135200910 isoform X2 n=1 Tax=Macrobrachium nipponense TaxID=159736 RepID=UPI0030C7DDBE